MSIQHWGIWGKVNVIPGLSRTGFRDEAEQFQADPGKVFGFVGMISTGS
jgi:hypothetical protein